MASGKSNFLRNAVLNHMLRVNAYTAPSTVYLAVSTAGWAASVTGTSLAATEPPEAAGYTRVAVPNDDTMWTEATAGSSTNLLTVEYDDATGSWGTLTSFYVVDAPVGGNTLWGGDLYVTRSIGAGDSAKFSQGQLNISEA